MVAYFCILVACYLAPYLISHPLHHRYSILIRFTQAKNDVRCPCCTREFANDDELNAFHARVNELADPDVSELHAMASKKSGQVREAVDKYRTWQQSISGESRKCVFFYLLISLLRALIYYARIFNVTPQQTLTNSSSIIVSSRS